MNRVENVTWSSTRGFYANKRKDIENRVKVQCINFSSWNIANSTKKKNCFHILSRVAWASFCFKKNKTRMNWDYEDKCCSSIVRLLRCVKDGKISPSHRSSAQTISKCIKRIEKLLENKRKKNEVDRKLWINASLETFLNTKWFL